MRRYVDFVVKHRKILIGIFIVINLLAIWGVTRLEVSPEFDVFTPKHSEYEETLQEMEGTFGSSNQLIFLLESGGEALTVDKVTSFHNFQTHLSNVNGVTEVKGPAPDVVAAGRERVNLEEVSQADLPALASVGILLAGVATWYILPLILTGRVEIHRPSRTGGRGSELIKKVWGTPSIVVVGVLLILAIVGFNWIDTEFNQLMIYRGYTRVQESFEEVMEVNDGAPEDKVEVGPLK